MEEISITCPYCWQKINLYLERDIGDEKITVIEDCTVCCRPIEVTYATQDLKVKNYEYHAIEGNS
jgi:hypothetical protein